MKYPICQMKNMKAEYLSGDDVFVIEEDDGRRVELTSQDMRILMEWREGLIRIHAEATGR